MRLFTTVAFMEFISKWKTSSSVSSIDRLSCCLMLANPWIDSRWPLRSGIVAKVNEGQLGQISSCTSLSGFDFFNPIFRWWNLQYFWTKAENLPNNDWRNSRFVKLTICRITLFTEFMTSRILFLLNSQYVENTGYHSGLPSPATSNGLNQLKLQDDKPCKVRPRRLG